MTLTMFIIGAAIAVICCWSLASGNSHPHDTPHLTIGIALGGVIMFFAILLDKGLIA